MSEQDLPRYYSELSDLREIFSNQINIKIGLEIDYIEGAEELLLPIIEQYALDFRIGSIHCIPHFGWKHISELQNKSSEPILLEYFRLVQAALSSKLFHSIAHIDFIWRDTEITSSNIDIICEQIDEILRTAVVNKTCVEVNANGFLWAQAQHTLPINPFDYFIGQIKNCGALITIGSDAHEPYYVGKSLSPIIQMLLSKGINRVCRFSEGKMCEESLE
jgi:histidinol-phosphatase (PHP family)